MRDGKGRNIELEQLVDGPVEMPVLPLGVEIPVRRLGGSDAEGQERKDAENQKPEGAP
jgi:hypothetical protein